MLRWTLRRLNQETRAGVRRTAAAGRAANDGRAGERSGRTGEGPFRQNPRLSIGQWNDSDVTKGKLLTFAYNPDYQGPPVQLRLSAQTSGVDKSSGRRGVEQKVTIQLGLQQIARLLSVLEGPKSHTEFVSARSTHVSLTKDPNRDAYYTLKILAPSNNKTTAATEEFTISLDDGYSYLLNRFLALTLRAQYGYRDTTY